MQIGSTGRHRNGHRHLVRTVALILPLLVTLTRAESPDQTTPCADPRIDELRASGRYDDALELARARSAACAAVPGTALWQRGETGELVETLERITALPEQAQQELAQADGLQLTYEEARDRWRLDEAVDVATEQLTLRRAHLGNLHPWVFDSSVCLATAVQSKGDVEDGVRLMQEAVSLGRQVFPGDHPDLARAIDQLSEALADLVEGTDERRRLALESLEMRRRLFGEEHTEVAASMHTLAAIAAKDGDFDEMKRLQLEALEMRRRLLGPEHLDVADSLQRVGYLAQESALKERLLREALAIRRRLLPANDPLIAETLGTLADVVRWQYDLVEAEEMLTEVVAIQRATFGSHLATSGTLERLAMLHRFRKEYEKSYPLLQETVAIRTQALGPEHRVTLTGVANLALNHLYRGDTEVAERLFAEVRVLTAKHGLDSLDGLLDVYMAHGARHIGRYTMAAKYFVKYIDRLRLDGKKTELADMLRKLGGCRAALGDLDGAEKLFMEAASVFEVARRTVTPGIKSATFKPTPYEQLALVRLERGKVSEAWPALEAARGRVLADLLVAAEVPQAEGLADAPFTLDRVQKHLTPGRAIVGWLDFGLYPQHASSWGYVVRKDRPVRWVRLPSDASVDDLAKRVRAFRDTVGRTGSLLGAERAPVAAESRRLWEERFAPLEPHLDGVEQLVLIPSWVMGGFPVGALLDDRDRVLAERFTLSYVPSATFHAWLAQTRSDRAPGQRQALLIGDPPFHATHLASKAAPGAPADTAEDVAALRSALRGDARSIGRLPRLYGSREEVNGIAPLFDDTTILMGELASESRVDALMRKGLLASYDVVHIATHALIDNEKPERSGLVLSQLGLADRMSLDASEAKDGIVSGDEIVESWKLEADLVTLSACQTALGKNIFGEGVVGLSYPFLRAGARGLLLSLWKVDDEATALLMREFYRRWLGGEIGKAQALQEAKQWLRDYRDESGKRPYEHPYYWSAFILLGDPS